MSPRRRRKIAARRPGQTRMAGTRPLRSSEKNQKKLDFHMAVSFSDVRTADDEYEYDDEHDCHPSCCLPERT